uniref:Uncharacterized protein n=1 Tax=Arundo donax TaxID=35708 RepID=A0A0A9E7A6_ARUDO
MCMHAGEKILAATGMGELYSCPPWPIAIHIPDISLPESGAPGVLFFSRSFGCRCVDVKMRSPSACRSESGYFEPFDWVTSTVENYGMVVLGGNTVA